MNVLVKCSTRPGPSGLPGHAGLQVRLRGIPVLGDAAVPEGVVLEPEDVDKGRVTAGVSVADPNMRDDEVATLERSPGIPGSPPAPTPRCEGRPSRGTIAASAVPVRPTVLILPTALLPTS